MPLSNTLRIQSGVNSTMRITKNFINNRIRIPTRNFFDRIPYGLRNGILVGMYNRYHQNIKQPEASDNKYIKKEIQRIKNTIIKIEYKAEKDNLDTSLIIANKEILNVLETLPGLILLSMQVSPFNIITTKEIFEEFLKYESGETSEILDHVRNFYLNNDEQSMLTKITEITQRMADTGWSKRRLTRVGGYLYKTGLLKGRGMNDKERTEFWGSLLKLSSPLGETRFLKDPRHRDKDEQLDTQTLPKDLEAILELFEDANFTNGINKVKTHIDKLNKED